MPPRRRRIWPILLVLGLIALPILFLIGALALFIGMGDGFDGDFSASSMNIQPATIDDLPHDINEGAGEIHLDLTDLNATDFADLTTPFQLEIDLNAGQVVIDLPEDVPVSVDASASAGDVSVLEHHSDGIRPRVDIMEEDALLELDIRIGVGEVNVSR